LIAFGVFIFAFSVLMLYEAALRPNAIAELYFHGIPSESMMQVVSILDLKQNFFQSVWNIHIQPPLFDVLRGVLALLSNASDPLQLQYSVDRGLYIIWGLIYGLMASLMYRWLNELTNSWFALLATLIFIASPATLLYATLLETTFLSSFLIFYFIFLLWRINKKEFVSPLLLSASFLILFFTRSIFQWQWILIITLCLILLRYPLESIKKYLLISVAIVGIFLFKQFMLFDLVSTSSFTGLNLCQSIGACKSHYIPVEPLDHLAPAVLVREKKLTGAHNFNSLIDLKLNKAYLEDYKGKLAVASISELITNYYQNLIIYFQPSSNYASTNALLVNIPPRWKNYYEKFFSAPVLPALLIIATLFWMATAPSKEMFGAIGVFIPVLMIFTISILFESGENMRFKFFIEPILFIFIASQVYSAGLLIWNLFPRGRGDSKKAA
jgi:hypothetical protein